MYSEIIWNLLHEPGRIAFVIAHQITPLKQIIGSLKQSTSLSKNKMIM